MFPKLLKSPGDIKSCQEPTRGEPNDLDEPYTLSAGPSWKVLTTALRGDALGAFPSEAFEQEVVVHRLLGRSQFIINRPEAIRHILVENARNYVRPAPTIRVLRPLFGSGLFLSAGEEWKQQRRTVAPAFAPRAVRILARHVAVAANALVTDLKASNNRPIQLVPVLQRLALEVIGSAMFSLEMKRYGGELCHLILFVCLVPRPPNPSRLGAAASDPDAL